MRFLPMQRPLRACMSQHPVWYRQGIGTTLLQAMESAITVPRITVWVMTQGTHGPAFYVRHGFRIEPETEKMFGLIDKEFPIVRYSKILFSNG